MINNSHTSTGKILTSCMIGNVLEWYDFIIYGYFVVIFGQIFFPNADLYTQLLASWGIFWGGFLARPLGSLFFGYIGDKSSRKSALTLSIFLMAIPTTLMGMLPTYQQVGLLAPFLLVMLRLVQGFAIGGEYTGSMVFLVEHASMNKRGAWGSWASFSAILGIIIGSSVVALLHGNLSSEAMLSWGWRVPFLISIVGSVVGIYIRMNLADPAVYLALKARKKQENTPLKDLLMKYKGKVALIFMVDILTAVGFFIIGIFLVTYLRTYIKYTEHTVLTMNTINLLLMALATLVGGWLSDRVGRKPVMGTACLALVMFTYPLFVLLHSGQAHLIFFGQGALGVLYGLFFGVIPTVLSEILPTNVRFSGLSIGHNLCLGIIGGGTPFVATHLIQYTRNLYIPAYLIILASIISLLSLLFFKDHYRSALD